MDGTHWPDIEMALVYNDAVRPDVTWDGYDIPFSKHSFDCIIATEVSRTCPDIARILVEMRRVLRPEKRLLYDSIFMAIP